MDRTLPTTGERATEPARTIANYFADKVQVKTIVTAIAGLIAAVAKVTVADDVIDNVVTIIMFAAFILTPIIADREKREIVKDQGEETRKAVYAPATVKRLVDEAYAAGTPPTEAKPSVPSPTLANDSTHVMSRVRE